MIDDSTIWSRPALSAHDSLGTRVRSARHRTDALRVEPTTKRVWVVFAGVMLADSRRALCMLEPAHPPVYYFPPEDVRHERLTPSNLHTWRESLGVVSYLDAQVGDRVARDAAWYYATPASGYQALAGCIAFYPDKMDACYVDGDRVWTQTGDSSGGWITSELERPSRERRDARGW